MNYHYILPGKREERVIQATAYAHGLGVISVMTFQSMPHGSSLPNTLATTMPSDRKGIEHVAQGSVDVLFYNDPNLTNEPDLFRSVYVQSFVGGYLFSLYALPHGLLRILHTLPPDDRYAARFVYAWKRFVQEPIDGPIGTHIDKAANKIKALHKHYRKLN